MTDKEFDIIFAFLLKDAIRLSPYTQTELAKELGISIPTLTRYVTGSVSPSIRDVRRIANVLNIDMSVLANPSDELIEYAYAAIRSRMIDKEPNEFEQDRIRKMSRSELLNER